MTTSARYLPGEIRQISANRSSVLGSLLLSKAVEKEREKEHDTRDESDDNDNGSKQVNREFDRVG